MGLNAVIGIFAETMPADHPTLVAQLDQMNSYLLAVGLPRHEEPTQPLPLGPIAYEMLGYTGIHYLRRLAAQLWARAEPTPAPPDSEPASDPQLEAYQRECDWTVGNIGTRFFRSRRRWRRPSFDHLVFHSDAEGCYLPRPLEGVLLTWSEGDAYTQAIGSSQELLEECAALAAVMGLPLDLDPESDEVWRAMESAPGESGWKRFGREAFVCLRLHRLADYSLRTGAAVVFT